MQLRFSVGEMAEMCGVSKQALIYYDKEGVFSPAFVDPANKYRYYGVEQVEVLDSILMLRDMGMPLADIRAHMQCRDAQVTRTRLHAQLRIVREKMARLALTEKRISRKIEGLKGIQAEMPLLCSFSAQRVMVRQVACGGGIAQLDIALKRLMKDCVARALPVEYLPGSRVLQSDVETGEVHRFAQAFLPLLGGVEVPEDTDFVLLPAGLYACAVHCGAYLGTGETYRRLLMDIASAGYAPCGDALEYYTTDVLATAQVEEYRTQIRIPVMLREEKA